ncbi:hypothetical protein [Evtepia sp.]|uniref:hypothetical protein n=1 Tax=Evtepia sp. TaxID=2773933 RepID=UPI003F15861E
MSAWLTFSLTFTNLEEGNVPFFLSMANMKRVALAQVNIEVSDKTLVKNDKLTPA